RLVRRARGGAAVGRRAAARDVRARARARARGAAARRADLGARRGRARRSRAHARRLARGDLDRARDPRPRAGRAVDDTHGLDPSRERGLIAAAAGSHVSLGQVAGTLVLVAIAIGVSFWRRADIEKDVSLAVVRSFVQLTAVGYVIKGIFDSDSLWLVVALLAFMVVFGAWTARRRA